MWKSTRKEDEVTAPAESAPRPMQSPAPPVARPVDLPRMEAPRSVDVATIGKSVIVRGELSGSEDLYVDGEVEGSISLKGQSLTIGPNGRVRANLEARNVIVHGRVDGNVVASDRVDLRKSASLTGDISTARVAIEDGAYFKGTIDIQKAEPARAETKPAATAAPPAAPVAPGPTPAPSPLSQGSLIETKKFS
jgi:cytoskeletal protein CcmA (bactofilin family)